MKERLRAKTTPLAPAEAQIFYQNCRLTVLAPELVRVETAKDGRFCDAATQIVWHRGFTCPFEKTEDAKGITVTTAAASYRFDKRKKKIVSVLVGGKTVSANNKDNLKGTARTLDFCYNKVKLLPGIIGRNGVAVMEDNSLILDEKGMPAPRNSEKDYYVFASTSPADVMKAFFAITGYPPLVPRYALGNWWSRYYAYRQEEYLALVDRFAAEGIPFTVATIDMDWHWVDVTKRFGYKGKGKDNYVGQAGWTGYSWNTELFPDYKQFLSDLHARGLRTTVNLHPASGVRPFETQYEAMCKAVGQDPAQKNPVPFDITDEKFIEAYFECLHEPYEDDGVDFWWMDWQQGKKTNLEGLDPLWALNHYHTLNSSRGNKKPLILSRYSGPGSHRYPLGFSGDTVVFWRVLSFEIYFTVNAANAGYMFWSHDIGGHQLGWQKSDELYLRWLQFGVFSPILRLHSTKYNLSKEPWNHPSVREEAVKFLRLRHALIPYIYTMCHRTSEEGRALVEPMYYNHPDEPGAYKYKNEYYFGTELIVCPVSRPANKKTGLAETALWLPEGQYTNLITGEKLSGGCHTVLSGPDSLPVYAKSGAIIPMSGDPGNACGNPQKLEVLAYCGEGAFTLYEDADDLSYEQGNFVKTAFTMKTEKDKTVFTAFPAEGNAALIPSGREITVDFRDAAFTEVNVAVDGALSSDFIREENKITFRYLSKEKTEIIIK